MINESTITQLIPGKVNEVYQAWWKEVWFTSTLFSYGGQPSSTDRLEGSTRTIWGTQYETISSIGPWNEQYPDNIATIAYSFTQKMGDSGQAFVRFVPTNGGTATVVIWTVKVLPSTWSTVFCCGGTVPRLMVRTMNQHALTSLLHVFEQKHEQH